MSPQYCWVVTCAEEIFDGGESRLKRAEAISSMRAKDSILGSVLPFGPTFLEKVWAECGARPGT